MTNFAALGLSERLTRALTKINFTTPTEIQAGAIPPLLQHRDVLGLAETGTGKTAAFLLPLIDRLLEENYQPQRGQARALILAPTRELAQQIGQALRSFSGFARLNSAVIFGGAPYSPQIRALKGGLDILIATPGRLMDHVERGSVQFSATTTFILDEADRMLDMGFVPDVRAIHNALPQHQTVLFSATMNPAVERLTKELMHKPIRIQIAQETAVSKNVSHQVMHLMRDDKKEALKDILRQEQGQSIVFTKTKHGADKLSKQLSRDGFSTDAIHGDRNQRQRQRTLQAFRKGDVQILIATDVAARGIDVPGIARVINFDLPIEPDSYIHRIGRTGRNGQQGEAISLCPAEDMNLLRAIERLLDEKIKIIEDHDYYIEAPQYRSAGKNRPSRNAARGRNKLNKAPRRSANKPMGRTQSNKAHRKNGPSDFGKSGHYNNRNHQNVPVENSYRPSTDAIEAETTSKQKKKKAKVSTHRKGQAYGLRKRAEQTNGKPRKMNQEGTADNSNVMTSTDSSRKKQNKKHTGTKKLGSMGKISKGARRNTRKSTARPTDKLSHAPRKAKSLGKKPNKSYTKKTGSKISGGPKNSSGKRRHSDGHGPRRRAA
ncbi:MAG: DEAD/DEAH box helicase [bacterium]